MHKLTKLKVRLGRLLGLRSERDKTSNRRAAAICAWQLKHQRQLRMMTQDHQPDDAIFTEPRLHQLDNNLLKKP